MGGFLLSVPPSEARRQIATPAGGEFDGSDHSNTLADAGGAVLFEHYI